MGSLLLLLLVACGLFDDAVLDAPTTAPTPPAPRASGGVALHRRPDLLDSVELPPSNRPEGAPAPVTFHPPRPFTLVEADDGVDVWATPLPVRASLFPDRRHSTHRFGSDAPPGWQIAGPRGLLRFGRRGRAVGRYGFDREWLYVGLPQGAPPPRPEEYTIRFPRATEAEDALNHETSGLDARAFALRSFTLDTVTHSGVYLPAPAVGRWRVHVPDRGVLGFRATVLEPAVRSAVESDGATIVVEVRAGGEAAEVGRLEVATGRWDDGRFDLGAWSGRDVELTVRTETGPSAVYDHVFLEGPAVWTPSDAPRRVVLAFVDTLRFDHLGLYGYERPTSPNLDRWAAHGAVFEGARTVAPWTLPSARAALSGRQPELWGEGPTLAERLADAGYHTEGIVANAFLSAPFEMDRGFARYTHRHLAPAEEVAELAREVLEAHPDRDVALLVHFMDPHLPYEEPSSHRWRFAGPAPPSLDAPTLGALRRVHPEQPGFEAIRDHVVARYDQNVRYVDAELASVLEAAGPDATVAFFSDHGEELWDHGGFEHGHTFYEELLRVPLVLRGPGVPPGRHDVPVSLLDLAPTVMALEGLPADVEGAGRSLVPLLWGEPGAEEALAARPHAFGRPLYGPDGWGVVHGGRKWFERAGRQSVFDLRADPAEASDLAETEDLSPWLGRLGEALGREATLAWRLDLSGRTPARERRIEVWHPAGIRAAWVGYDPRGRHRRTRVEVEDGAVTIVQPEGVPYPPSVYVVPDGDPRDVVGLEITVSGVGPDGVATATRAPVDDGPVSPLLLALRSRDLLVRVGLARVPWPAGEAVEGFAEEVEDQLRELGYLE